MAKGNGWELDDSGTLTILSDEAWETPDWKSNAVHIIIEDGVTEIPRGTFSERDRCGGRF